MITKEEIYGFLDRAMERIILVPAKSEICSSEYVEGNWRCVSACFYQDAGTVGSDAVYFNGEKVFERQWYSGENRHTAYLLHRLWLGRN